MDGVSHDRASQALIELGRWLEARGYQFVTVTPETHRRVNARTGSAGHTLAADGVLRDVLGWSRPFAPELLPRDALQLLAAADALEQVGPLLRSRVRFSSLGERLHVHSAFPTEASDAVFFGPDTYRFCQLLRRWAPRARRLVDVGCGSGAGGLCLADRAQALVLADVNAQALRMAGVNAELARVPVERVESDVLAGVSGEVDLVIANPPYMRDEGARTYRDGGGAHGEALSLRIVREALNRLPSGGTLIMYTGAAVVDGVDVFRRAVMPLLEPRAVRIEYEELDPDVFGEELERPGYAEVERIAVVGLRVSCA